MILKDVIETKVINNLNWEENLFPTILSWHCKYEMPGPSLFKVIEGKDETYKREGRITESGWLFSFLSFEWNLEKDNSFNAEFLCLFCMLQFCVL